MSTGPVTPERDVTRTTGVPAVTTASAVERRGCTDRGLDTRTTGNTSAGDVSSRCDRPASCVARFSRLCMTVFMPLPLVAGCAMPRVVDEFENAITVDSLLTLTRNPGLQPGIQVDVWGGCTALPDSTIVIAPLPVLAAGIDLARAVVLAGVTRSDDPWFCSGRPALFRGSPVDSPRAAFVLDEARSDREASLIELIADPVKPGILNAYITVMGFCAFGGNSARLFVSTEDIRYGNVRSTVLLTGDEAPTAGECEGNFMAVRGRFTHTGDGMGSIEVRGFTWAPTPGGTSPESQ